jgi:hypothetical protein
MNQVRIFITSTLLLCFFCVPVASAQPEQRSPWIFTFDGGGAHQSDTDFSDTSGSFAVDRWYLGAGVNYGWSPRHSVGVSLGGGRNIYEFSDLSAFGGGEPWGTVEDARLTFSSRFPVGERGMAFIVPTVRLNGEKGASNSDSRTYGIFGAIAWQLKENLMIGPGLGVFTRLEDSARIFPILAIDWQFAERWSISTGGGLASSRGPGLTLSYQVSEEWSLGVAGRYEDLEFRLDDEGIAPGGVGRDQSLPIVFTAAMQAGKQLNFSVFAGVSLGGNLRLKDADDNVIEETDYDIAPVFGGTFELRF